MFHVEAASVKESRCCTTLLFDLQDKPLLDMCAVITGDGGFRRWRIRVVTADRHGFEALAVIRFTVVLALENIPQP